MIKISNIVKMYDKNIILKDVNIKVNRGEIFGLVGTSGAGKSTILKIINGLESVNQGNVIVDNIDVSSLENKEKRTFQKRIGMIFQNFALLERKTVFENVAFPLRCAKQNKEDINKKVEYLLNKVEISDKRDAMPSQLSGGQRQRVAIARALSLDPDILLCDEATSGLDPKTTNTILDLLRDINEKENITIIFVTHEMDVIERICDKVAVIEDGEVKAIGDVEDILFEYSNTNKIIKQDKSNVYINIQYNNSHENNNLLSKIALDNNISFSVEEGKVQQLKNNIVSNFTLKIKTEDYNKLEKYLSEKDINYNLLEDENNNVNNIS